MHIHFGHERWHQAASFALRYEIFILEQGISVEAEFDRFDTADRNYFAIYDNSLIIGTVRYQEYDSKTIQPDRFCIKKDHRKRGLGRMLLQQFEKKAISDGYHYSRLSSELVSQNFYEKLGYKVASSIYIEDGLPCILLVKKLI